MLVSVSNQFYNKEKLSPTAYQSFHAVEITEPRFINHVAGGNAFCPGIFANDDRKSENFLSAEIIGLDFDKGVSISDLVNHRHSNLLWFVYETPSSKPDYPKSRALIKLDKPITDSDEYQSLVRNALMIFSDLEPDKAPKDCARLFFGSDTDSWQLLDNTISIEQLKQLCATKHPDVKTIKSKPVNLGMVMSGSELIGTDDKPSVNDLRKTLSNIPPDKDHIHYSVWVQILMAIHKCYPDETGLAIAKEWTEFCSKPGEIERKWKSFRSGENG